MRKAIVLQPKSPVAFGNLAVVLAGQGKLDEAVAARRKATEIDPDNPSLHFDIGKLLQGQEEFEEAAVAYRSGGR